MIDHGKINVLGIGIDAVDYDAAVEKVIDSASARQPYLTTALAVHGLVTAARDPQHKHRLNTFHLAVPDGQPVRWALRALRGVTLPDRVYGPRLTLLVCERAAELGIPVYFYGSRPEIVDALCRRLATRFPRLKIAGYRPSLFQRLSAQQEACLANDIIASGARILFVGLGCPRQEIFAYEMNELLSMPILAVGAAFDYHAGALVEPPQLIQKYGLQWLYRLVQEPRRLWKRYLLTNTQFLLLLCCQYFHLWRPNRISGTIPPHKLRFG